jgi:hypothetical protein
LVKPVHTDTLGRVTAENEDQFLDPIVELPVIDFVGWLNPRRSSAGASVRVCPARSAQDARAVFSA